ncbi:pyruvate kinase [Celeribacter sp.]|uniref:pyruvate kinase n=1 Tax=Celeribacter sp. TaxID=1890673 RepID=UPI003A905C50
MFRRIAVDLCERPPMIRDRRTKIIATVGPASGAPAMLKTLLENGVDTFRLNFSHGDHATHAKTIAHIRALEREAGYPVGILQDLQGPKIRLGQLAGGKRVVRKGDVLGFILADRSDDRALIPLPHAEVFRNIRPGDRILIDDGRVRLRVINRHENGLQAEVLAGEVLRDRKGVNLPDCVLDLPVLTQKDRADLAFGLAHGVDWVALSFVQRATDLDEILAVLNGRAGLIAKIEKPSALDDIEAIVEKSAGIMIARGDLGVEIPPEQVPGYQKEIIALCRRVCRPVIVATQMLESMTASPTPTRAEASDVATAVYDGADAVMLSAESASGDYPEEAVAVMDRIVRMTEQHPLYLKAMSATRDAARTAADSIADTGAALAVALKARAIVAYSSSGSTAIRLAARRPLLPLVILTREPHVSRKMALVWGARSVLESKVEDYTSMVHTAMHEITRLLSPDADDCVVVLSGVPYGKSGSTNNIRVVNFDG